MRGRISTSFIRRVLLTLSLFILLIPLNSQSPGHMHHHQFDLDHQDSTVYLDVMNGATMNLEVPLLLVVMTQSQPHVLRYGKIVNQDSHQQDLLSTIKGKTLDVYNLMMNRRTEMGVREIQKELGYSSPNLAFYHVNKLVDAGIVEKTVHNKYRIDDQFEIKLGEFRDKFNVQGYWLSHTSIYSTIFGILALISAVLYILQASSTLWILIFFPTMTFLALAHPKKLWDGRG